MMLDFLRIILLYFVVFLPSARAYCDRVCGKNPPNRLPSPFGFSSGCKIQLNCTSNATMAIHGFPVQAIKTDIILVNVEAKCGRPIETMKRLFSANYAPTSHNGILLQNCSSKLTACLIPTTMVQTHFELQDCGNDTISCYSEQNNKSLFIDYQNLSRSNCRSLFSAISVEYLGKANSTAVSLDIQLVQLGWWLQGNCQCSNNAKCSKLLSPYNGKLGHRCECLEGFVGDGYKDGSGCQKETTSCSPSNYMSGRCGGTTRVGVLVGGVAAGATLMISLGLICCCIRRRRTRKHRKKSNRRLYEATGITIPMYPYKEIEKATNFFSEKRRLGTGAYGTVYSGRLHNDEWVAIKRIKYRDTDSIEQVINEIKLLSAVDHPNLVHLLGCSIEEGEQILVYEFMPNGTLSQHLQRTKGNGLPWPVRLTIAAETAQAIAYLHNAMHPPIYHRDIKSSNILLDYNFKSKLADFGLSRLGSTMLESSHISTAPQGTPGYLDPQYHQDFHLSDKSDVYSFGVVLVEIITALKAVDFSRPQNEVNLAALAVDRIGKGCLDEIIDPFLEANNSWTVSTVHKVAELAFRCLAFHRDMRPSMIEVAIELEQIRLSQWANSDVSLTSLSEAPSYASSSNISEKPLTILVSKQELENKDLFDSRISTDNMKDYSPVSMLDSLPSEQSSPSSNSLLSHVIQ